MIQAPIGYAYASTAMPISMLIPFLRGEEELGAPLRDQVESPLRRRLFFRYSLVWERPAGSGHI